MKIKIKTKIKITMGIYMNEKCFFFDVASKLNCPYYNYYYRYQLLNGKNNTNQEKKKENGNVGMMYLSSYLFYYSIIKKYCNEPNIMGKF